MEAAGSRASFVGSGCQCGLIPQQPLGSIISNTTFRLCGSGPCCIFCSTQEASFVDAAFCCLLRCAYKGCGGKRRVLALVWDTGRPNFSSAEHVEDLAASASMLLPMSHLKRTRRR